MLVTQMLAIHAVFTGAATLGGIIHVPADAPTIQSAIQQARLFDIIIVAPGTYSENINFGGKVITVQSENPADPNIVAQTIISSGATVPAVLFSGGEDENSVLDGFTITGGNAGISANSSLAAIRRCVVRDSTGYGILQADGIIEDCQILDNNWVGLHDCDGTIRRCVVRNNRASGVRDCDGTIVDSRIANTREGPGVSGGSANILRCIVESNAGGGVAAYNPTGGNCGSSCQHLGNIDFSVIVGNMGPGLDGQQADSGVINNSVVAGNRGNGFQSSRKHVVNCTVIGNLSFGFAGHLYGRMSQP